MTTVLGMTPISARIPALAKLRSAPVAAAAPPPTAAPPTVPRRTMVDQVKALRGSRVA